MSRQDLAGNRVIFDADIFFYKRPLPPFRRNGAWRSGVLVKVGKSELQSEKLTVTWRIWCPLWLPSRNEYHAKYMIENVVIVPTSRVPKRII